jgi:hypothetical protein
MTEKEKQKRNVALFVALPFVMPAFLFAKSLTLLMRSIGLEPMACCLGGSRSIHLSYERAPRNQPSNGFIYQLLATTRKRG